MKIMVSPSSTPQFFEQVEDLGLDRNVERGHGLVKHQHGRTDAQGAGQADTLALPAAQRAGRPRRHLLRKPYQTQQSVDFVRHCRVGHYAMEAQGFADSLRHRHPRIERRKGILEHHLQAAAQGLPRDRIGVGCLATEQHVARGGMVKPENGAA